MKLREIRHERGLSIPALSKKTGLHRRTLQDIEKRGDCRVSNALKIARALGVSLNDLCYDEKEDE